MILRNVVMILIMLGIVPLILGYPVRNMVSHLGNKARYLYAYVCGFFFMLAIFELLCVPAAYMGLTFNVLVIMYSITLLIVLCIIIKKCVSDKKNKQYSSDKVWRSLRDGFRKYTFFEWFYLLVFLLLFGIQIYGALFYFSTINSIDDATYVAYGASALQKNYIYRLSDFEGIYAPLQFHRVLQSSLIFNAYLAKIIGLPVATITHTVLNTVLLCMAYAVYCIMAEDLFEKKENQLVFLILLSFFYLFGSYSNYSHSFRLLATLWQGKAVLAVILTPLLFVVLRRILALPYQWNYGLFLMVLSIASISFSLMGVATMFFVIVLLTLLFVIWFKKWKLCLYIIWACVIPVSVGALYLLNHIV